MEAEGELEDAVVFERDMDRSEEVRSDPRPKDLSEARRAGPSKVSESTVAVDVEGIDCRRAARSMSSCPFVVARVDML